MIVSVIIPAYNAQGTIGRCLAALASQSSPAESYEVIVVDDGSKDETGRIVQLHKVRYIRQANRGPAAARNTGARLARGDIVLFTDADCEPDADWVRQMATAFDDPQVMAVKGAYRTRQTGLTARFAQLEFEQRFEMLKKADSIDLVDTYSAGYRRGIFLDMGGFDTSFPVANNEDTELSYRMSAKGFKMVFNPMAIVYHLRHPDTLGRYARLKFGRGYWRMVVYRRFPGKMLKDTYTPQSLKLQIMLLYMLAACAVLTIFAPSLMYALLGCAVLFVLISLPFAVFAIRRDLTVALLSGPFLLVRAGALGAGMIWAVFKLTITRGRD